MAEYDAPLLEHDADGIRELDNDLPRWWVWLFIITVVWGVLYMLYYHVIGIGYLSADEYRLEVNPAYVRVPAADSKLLGILPEYHSPFYDPVRDQSMVISAAAQMGPSAEEMRMQDTVIYVAVSDAGSISHGREIYTTRCATCHGMSGEGGIGPNLTDRYWLHGGDFDDIYKTIKHGVPIKGMISWRTEMSPEDLLAVASFVQTLRGTSPPNAKAPQGDVYEP